MHYSTSGYLELQGWVFADDPFDPRLRSPKTSPSDPWVQVPKASKSALIKEHIHIHIDLSIYSFTYSSLYICLMFSYMYKSIGNLLLNQGSMLPN